MNTVRLINIITSDIALECLKLQHDLEILLNNNDVDINVKVKKIKQLLKKLTNNELSLNKFKELVDTKLNQEENGKI